MDISVPTVPTLTPVTQVPVPSPQDSDNSKKRKLPSAPTPAGQPEQEQDGYYQESEEYQQLKRRRKIEPRGVPWFVMLDRLKQYRDRYGSLNVPSTFRQDPKLASWVQYQRYLFHHKEIAEERKAALDELGFEWSVLKPKSGGKKSSWDEQVARVAAYKEAHGNTLIPYSYQADPSLGFWVSKQRKDYKHGQLSQDKIEKLNAIDFVWKPPTGRRQGSKKKVEDSENSGANRQSTWEKMFEKLRQFQTIHGSERAHSRSDLNAIDKTLATWIKTQRHMYTIKKMSAERIAKLEGIGFAWRVGQDWKDFFARLKDYRDRFGTCDFPAGEDARLAAWIDSQRVSYKYRELPKERVEKLKSIGFSFVIDEGLEKLEASAPPVDEPVGVAVLGGVKTSPEEMTGLLDQTSGTPGAATATAPSQLPGDASSKLNEYNIAIHLAALADTKKDGETTKNKDKAATQVEAKQPKEEGAKIVLVDGMAGPGDQAPTQTETQVAIEAAEAALKIAERGQPAEQTMEVEGANEAKEPSDGLGDEDELALQAEIVELQEDKVRLQQEKVIAQQEKLDLLSEINALEARNKELTKEVEDDHSNSDKNELEGKARLHGQQLLKQAARIKEQGEKLRGLEKDLSEME